MTMTMRDEIRQKGEVILSSDDGISIPMIYNNLSGKNMKGKDYQDYLRHVALGSMGFVPGRIEFFRDGALYKSCVIPGMLY